MNTSEVIAISTADHKQAALLFDRIIPLHTCMEVPEAIRFNFSFDPHWNNDQEVLNIMTRLMKEGKSIDDIKTPLVTREVDNRLAAKFHEALTVKGMRSVPIFHSESIFNDYLQSGNDSGIKLTLTHVPIIDTTNISWDHVIDVRKDPDYRIKTARLRNYIDDTYTNKDTRFIVDDLNTRIYDYQEMCRRHGFELTLSTISQVLNSKSLLGTIGATILSALLSKPEMLVPTLTTGIAVEVGKVILNISEEKLKFKNTKQLSEVSYLVDVSEKLENMRKT